MRTDDILSKIIANKRLEVDMQKRNIPLQELQEQLTDTLPRYSMRKSLTQSATGIIAEFKRRSPSKGWIKEAANIANIIPTYKAAGAAALSILTDKTFFGGTLQDICTARPLVNIPILRKEFIIDEYQLYQTKIVGADTVLLIASALTPTTCQEFAVKAHELGLEVLLEIHNESELKYITPEIDMIGVNNRNLGTFQTCTENSLRLAKLLPSHMVLVSESGISKPETVDQMRASGFRGFLIGETFMKTENPGDTLSTFIHSLQH